MLQEPVCVKDFENYANVFVEKRALKFFSSGADDMQTLHEATAAFKRLRLRPRMLRDVSIIETSTTVLGQTIDFPVCISPTAAHKLVHPDGEMGTARAATHAGTCMALSIASNDSLVDVARSSSGLKWFQVNILNDFDYTANLIKSAEDHGYKAIVVTGDQPFIGKRYNELRDNVVWLPPHLKLGNLKNMYDLRKEKQDNTLLSSSVTWHVIELLRTVTKLPIVLKGILTAEDAKLAVQHGVDAILVSNHGGRQLDGVPATIEVLPEIVAAVGDKVEVYLDGGVRFGTDVFKALALGARAVFVGRPILWGLAYKGEEGVKKVLQILKDELKLTMGLCGCTCLKDIVKEMVVHQSHYSKL